MDFTVGLGKSQISFTSDYNVEQFINLTGERGIKMSLFYNPELNPWNPIVSKCHDTYPTKEGGGPGCTHN